MLGRIFRHLLVFSSLAIGASHVRAVAPEVHDQAKFFSAEELKKANEKIRDVMRQYDKDLMIETYATVAAEPGAERVKAMSRADRNKYFHTWAEDRVRAMVVNGIYILVCKEPPHVQVEVTPAARPQFGPKAYEKLIGMLIADFHEHHFDQGLERAIGFVQEQFAAASHK
jgi:hypothetical protein